MAVSRAHTYRVLKSSWGVLITIVAETREAEEVSAGAMPLGSAIWLLDATPQHALSEVVMQMLAEGIRPLVNDISLAVQGAARMIAIRDLRYNECDFQIEGLAAAMYGWAAAEFDLEVREVAVSFNRGENRYVFTLPGVESL